MFCKLGCVERPWIEVATAARGASVLVLMPVWVLVLVLVLLLMLELMLVLELILVLELVRMLLAKLETG